MLDLLQLGLSAFGMGQANRANRKQWEAYQQQNAISQQQFREQMDTSVQRRVADAKKAGIHPLFAMGASVGASPTFQSGQAPTGSGMGDAIAGLAESLGMVDLNRAATERDRAAAKRDLAESQYLDTQKRLMMADFMSRGRDGARTYPYGSKKAGDAKVEYGPMGDPEFYRPQIPQHGSNPGIVAGTRPGEIDVKMADGSTVRLYDPDLGLDEIGQVRYVFQRMLHWDRKASAWTKTQLRKLWEDAKRETRGQSATGLRGK